MTVVSKDNAPHYHWGDKPGEPCDGWHLARSEALSVIQERVPPGASETRHAHRYAEQFFYVLQGIATIEIDGHVYVLSNGEGITVSSGQAHRLSNESTQDLHFLVISTPPSHGDRVDAGG
jgi:mannose-6-phosphate isomerase-like protein (cupin superfamily)